MHPLANRSYKDLSGGGWDFGDDELKDDPIQVYLQPRLQSHTVLS
jgi:hypothetical protein